MNALVGFGAAAALAFFVSQLDLNGWLSGAIVGLGWIPAYLMGFVWSDRGREGDIKKLARLPQWEEAQRGAG